MGLGTKIHKLREEQGLRLVDLAAAVGVDPSAVHYWETDRRAPQLKNLRKLAEALGVPMSYFLTDEPSTPKTIIAE